MNKRGFLLAEETLKLVLAMICIALLAYLLFSLYQANEDSKDLKLAKESLNFLMSEINSGKNRVDIYNPTDWQLGIWPHVANVVVRSGAYRIDVGTQFPSSCSNLGWTSCICICKEDTAKSCDDGGTCLNNTLGFKMIGDFGQEGRSIKIENPPITLNIDQTDQTNKKISKAESQSGLGGGGGEGF